MQYVMTGCLSFLLAMFLWVIQPKQESAQATLPPLHIDGAAADFVLEIQPDTALQVAEAGAEQTLIVFPDTPALTWQRVNLQLQDKKRPDGVSDYFYVFIGVSPQDMPSMMQQLEQGTGANYAQRNPVYGSGAEPQVVVKPRAKMAPEFEVIAGEIIGQTSTHLLVQRGDYLLSLQWHAAEQGAGLLQLALYPLNIASTAKQLWYLEQNSVWRKLTSVRPGRYLLNPSASVVQESNFALLQQQATACRLLQSGRLLPATAYLPVEHVWQFEQPLESAECKKTLKLLYNTPSGQELTTFMARQLAMQSRIALLADTDIALSNKAGVRLAASSNLALSSEQASLLPSRLDKAQWQVFDQTAPLELRWHSAAVFYVYGHLNQVPAQLHVDAIDIPGVVEPLLHRIRAVQAGSLSITPAPASAWFWGMHSEAPRYVKPQVFQQKHGSELKPTSMQIYLDRHQQPLRWQDVPHVLAPGYAPKFVGTTTLTLDATLQQQVQTLLNQAPSLSEHFSQLLVMNLQGELLALAQTPQAAVSDVYPQYLAYQQRQQPMTSRLTLRAGYHDGSSKAVSGSIFKLITTLAASRHVSQTTEQWPQLATFLNGLSVAQWRQTKVGCFDASSAVYPAVGRGCKGRDVLKNLDDYSLLTLTNKYPRSHYGVVDALADSQNGYFAAMADELIKATPAKIRHFTVLNNLAWQQADPIRAEAARLGWFDAIDLSAGQVDVRGTGWAVTPGKFQDIDNSDSYRSMSVGNANATTAIHQAQIVAAIASGHKVTARLLLGTEKALEPLYQEAELKWVRAGMAAAAKRYFPNNSMGRYFKTGTGSIDQKSRHNAWMVGYVEAGTQTYVVVCNRADVPAVGADGRRLFGAVACSDLVDKLSQLLQKEGVAHE